MSGISRDEVVRQCANAVAGCWNHYSDKRLNPLQLRRLEAILADNLPEEISTLGWQEFQTRNIP